MAARGIADMAAEDPVGKFLEALRAGYGAKWGPVFEGFGLELVEDLLEAPPDELSQLEDRLAAAGAGPAHIRRMRQAIGALRGEEAAGAPAPQRPSPSPSPPPSAPGRPAAAGGAQERPPATVPNPFNSPRERPPATAPNPFNSPRAATGAPQRPAAPAARGGGSEWQAGEKTPDGMQSYVNTRTGEVRWEAPGRAPADIQRAYSSETVSTVNQDDHPPHRSKTTPLNPGLTLTSQEAVMSQAAQMMDLARTAFQRSQDGSAAAPGPDEPPVFSHKGNWHATGAEHKWTHTELEAYDKAYREVDHDPAKASDYLDRAGLPSRAMTEIKRIGCIDIGTFAGPQQFYACCRLVAHCQALQYEDGGFEILGDAGEALRQRLPDMLASPPPRLPQFKAS